MDFLIDKSFEGLQRSLVRQVTELERRIGGLSKVRMFANVSDLGGWGPPDGAFAYVSDESAIYVREGGVWVSTSRLRVFADMVALAVWTPADGTQAFVQLENRVYVRVAGGWQPSTPGAPFASAQGSVSITPVANTVVSVSVTFPVGRFTVIPRGYANARTSRPDLCEVTASNETTSGMTIHTFRTNTTGYTVNWHAIQMTESSANG